MHEEPLVSIVIPTYNSEKTLPLTLTSIKMQTYKNVEVIVVDSYSTDRTVEIARKFGAKIIQTHGGLLWARYLGHLYAKGEIEVLLDSDQILHPAAIERAVKMITQKECDALILGESSYKPKTIIQWLFYFDRMHVHKIKDLHPIHGVLLARVYKSSILNKAFRCIMTKLPIKTAYQVISQDHALIHYESWKYLKRICIIKNAVYHIEPKSISQIIKKYYRYGSTDPLITKYYPKLAHGKKIPRKPSLSPEYLASMFLWLLKTVPYAVGSLMANLVE